MLFNQRKFRRKTSELLRDEDEKQAAVTRRSGRTREATGYSEKRARPARNWGSEKEKEQSN